jgi:hypothetical protein
MQHGTVAPMPPSDPSGPMNELLFAYNRQKYRSPFLYDSGIVLVPNNTPGVAGGSGRFASTIITQADDIIIKRILGFSFGPCNSNGQVNLAASGNATDFPNPINPFLAVHGVSLKITDTKTGRAWSNNPIPIECMTPKGYSNQTNAPYDWEWLIPGNSTLQLEWFNADTRAQPGTDALQYHAAFIALEGDRFNGLRVT